MKHHKCEVLRPVGGHDCTNHGITSRFATLTVVTEVPYLETNFMGKTYYDHPNEKAVEDYIRQNGLEPEKTLLLCDKVNNDIYTPYLKPLDSVYGINDGETLVGPCAGGNYAVFRDPRERIYRVHDRYDTQEAWDTLSR